MVVGFGTCELDLERRELRRAGVMLALEPKAFRVLVHLLTQRHRVVSKEELLETCWPGEHVTDAALARCVRVIRQAVDDDGERQQIIKTLRGHGYRFVAAVTTHATLDVPPPTPRHQSPPHLDAAVHTPTVVPPGVAYAALFPAQPSVMVSPMDTAALACAWCQTVNRAARQFCAACSHKLWRACSHCGFGNAPTEFARVAGSAGGFVSSTLAPGAVYRAPGVPPCLGRLHVLSPDGH